MTSFLHDLPDDPEEIQMCDIEIYGTCDHCDHPCRAYFEHHVTAGYEEWDWYEMEYYDDDTD